MAAMIDKEPPHRLRAECQSVRTSLPFDRAVVLQPQPGFVNQGCRLKSVVPPFPVQITSRYASQLTIDQREQLAGGLLRLRPHRVFFRCRVFFRFAASVYERHLWSRERVAAMSRPAIVTPLPAAVPSRSAQAPTGAASIRGGLPSAA